MERVECSKLSMAVYFADYVDSTTGILGAFRAFDADGKPIPCDWSFIADQTDDSCMSLDTVRRTDGVRERLQDYL